MATLRDTLVDLRVRLTAAGCDAASMESEQLAAYVLGVSRSQLLAMRSHELTAQQSAKLDALAKRREHREPLAYVIGHTEFRGRPFHVTRDVLIPRMDTEALVNCSLALIDELKAEEILELGTGSGCVALTLLAERPQLRAHATDISARAVAVCAKNAAALGVGARLTMRTGSWFEPIPAALKGTLPLIISNPPYVASVEAGSLQPEVVNHEPHVALFAGPDGLDHIRTILCSAQDWLAPGGWLALEVGFDQAAHVNRLARDFHYGAVAVHDDTAGVPRVVVARRNDGRAQTVAH